MNVFWVLLGIAVLGGVAVVASGRGDGLANADPDRADLTLPTDRPAAREDVDRLRFAVGVRGYRMDEVDDVLDRLAHDIALRDQQILELESHLAQHGADPELGALPEPAEPSGPAEPSVPAEPVEPVESAAMVPPVESHSDPMTTRTLLVPLETYTEHGSGDAGDAGFTADSHDAEDSAGE